VRLGIDQARICLDPGIGFGKTVQQNFHSSHARHRPFLKAMRCWRAGPANRRWRRVTHTSLAQAAGMNVELRRASSVTAAVLAVQNGAHVVRVHDVRGYGQRLAGAGRYAGRTDAASQRTLPVQIQ